MDGNDKGENSETTVENTRRRILELEEIVKRQKWNYSAHEELVTLVRNSTDFSQQNERVKLENVRESMSESVPLSESQWIQWISDKVSQPHHENQEIQLKSAMELCQRALNDYISVPIILNYIQYAIQLYESDHTELSFDVDELRFAFEYAVSKAGLHFTRANSIWKLYIEAESLFNDFIKRDEIITRSLSIPVLDYDSHLEYISTLTPNLVQNNSSVIQQTKRHVEERLPLENALIQRCAHTHGSLSSDGFQVWKQYVNLEHQLNPNRAVCVLERMVASHFISEQAWLYYAKYLTVEVSDYKSALSVLSRAIRNLPLSHELVVAHIQTLERLKKSWFLEPLQSAQWFAKTLASVYGKVSVNEQIQSMLSPVVHAVVYCACRQIRREKTLENDEGYCEKLDSVVEFMVEHVDGLLDCALIQCELNEHVARVAYEVFGDVKTARHSMENVVRGPLMNANRWCEYARLEAQYVMDNRSVMRRALASLNDESVVMQCGAYFVMLEQQFAESIDAIDEVQKVVEKRLLYLEQQQPRKQQKSECNHQTKRTHDGKHLLVQRTTPKADARVDSNTKMIDQSEGNQKASAGVDKEHKTAEVSGGERDAKEQVSGMESSEKQRKTSEQQYRDEYTVFINNLDEKVDENQLIELFSRGCEGFRGVRLVQSRDGKSRCFAYADFESESGVKQAIKLHHTKLHDKKIWIRKSKPPSNQSNSTSRSMLITRNQSKSDIQRKPRLDFNPIPRSVQHPSHENDSTAEMHTESPESTLQRPLNQDDFRKMLSKK